MLVICNYNLLCVSFTSIIKVSTALTFIICNQSNKVNPVVGCFSDGILLSVKFWRTQEHFCCCCGKVEQTLVDKSSASNSILFFQFVVWLPLFSSVTKKVFGFEWWGRNVWLFVDKRRRRRSVSFILPQCWTQFSLVTPWMWKREGLRKC